MSESDGMAHSKILTELDGALSEALHNCFSLTIAQIDGISRDERIAIFKELAGIN